ncbi:TonB-dependent receptor [Flectobacillus major]|uniref:TonB-dependent receptor n=1 Tax=Flectobacillus major TaxID=103 RepID=UPI000478EB6A|nr:carboxypeptidase-like regulatory domain-containing protein [Flectobacillus major]
MKFKYLLTSICIFCFTSVSAQSVVEGILLDSLTQSPLQGASVVVDFSKRLSSTTTDAKGHFYVSVPEGSHVLKIRYLGYLPISLYIPKGGNSIGLVFKMKAVANEIEQVIVTTKGLDKTVRQPLLGVNQISIKNLEKLPAAFGELDLLRGIQMLPGVTSVGEASNGVNIRGGTTDQNLILLDDTPIFNPTHMFGLFSVFPPDAVSNLDLFKGNVPGRFGGRAASVIDVKLKNPSLDKLHLKGGISIVSNRVMADIPIVKEKLGIYIAGRGAFNDFMLPLASEKFNDIKTKFGEGVSKLFWRINSKNTFTAMGYTSLDYFKTNLLPNLPNVVGTSTYYNHQTTNAMMRWYHVISSKIDIQTTAVFAQYSPTIATTEYQSDNAVKLASSLLQKQLKSNINYQLDNFKIETGLSFTQYIIKPGTLNPNKSVSVQYITTPTEYANEMAWYGDTELALSTKLALSLGLRYSYFAAMGPSNYRNYQISEPRDDFSVIDTVQVASGKVIQSYGGFEPRIGIRYTLNENSSLKFGYNLMRQYLQVVSNTTTPIPTSRWKTSDKHIKPQISNLVSAGYYRNLKDNIYEVSVEGYFRYTQNMVDYKPGADFLLQQYPETQIVQGESRAYGLELMVSKKKGKLTGWANYTYSRTENRTLSGLSALEKVNNGNWYAANYDRPHSLNTSIDIFVNDHNSFSFTFVYSTGRPYTEPVGFINYLNNFYPFYDQRNNKRIPDYHRLDFAWNIYNPTMKNKKVKSHWSFTAYNLYAHKNVYSVFFKSENGVNKAYQLQIFAAPIVSIAYNFEF